jgi:hypothetical protein
VKTSPASALLIAAAALFAGGFFLPVLLIPGVAVAVAAIVVAVRPRPTALLVAAWLFVALAIVGFVALTLSWGKLEYGLLGYLVLWGPIAAALCAIVLFAEYLRR